MKIAVISDSHDHIDNLRKAIKIIKTENINYTIHCGDFCAPFIIKELSTLEHEVFGVFGNVDGDKYRILQNKPDNVQLYPEFAELKIDNTKIAVVHYPELAKILAYSGKYKVVFYGHTHIRKIEKIGSTLLVNPGEIMNLNSDPSFIIYNSEDNKIKTIVI